MNNFQGNFLNGLIIISVLKLPWTIENLLQVHPLNNQNAPGFKYLSTLKNHIEVWKKFSLFVFKEAKQTAMSHVSLSQFLAVY